MTVKVSSHVGDKVFFLTSDLKTLLLLSVNTAYGSDFPKSEHEIEYDKLKASVHTSPISSTDIGCINKIDSEGTHVLKPKNTQFTDLVAYDPHTYC